MDNSKPKYVDRTINSTLIEVKYETPLLTQFESLFITSSIIIIMLSSAISFYKMRNTKKNNYKVTIHSSHKKSLLYVMVVHLPVNNICLSIVKYF